MCGITSHILWLFSRGWLEQDRRDKSDSGRLEDRDPPGPGLANAVLPLVWGFSPGQCRPYRHWALPRVLGHVLALKPSCRVPVFPSG